MRCPNCNGQMAPIVGASNSYGCTLCQGVWLQADRHRRIATEESPGSSNKIRQALGLKCSVCRVPLVKVKPEGVFRNITALFCPTCQGTFLNWVDFCLLRKERQAMAKNAPKEPISTPTAPSSQASYQPKPYLVSDPETMPNDRYYQKYDEDRDLGVKDYIFSLLTGWPVEINVAPQKTAYVTYALITFNILFFVLLAIAHNVLMLALIPNDPKIYAYFTHMFSHADIFHLLGNMYFLYVFGDNVEDRLGKGLYLLFYFICGFVAIFLFVAMNSSSHTPIVGASGAISGVMGAYLLACPKAKMGMVVFFYPLKVPAMFYFFLWVAFQFLLSTIHTNVAWQAHLGGFFCGLILYPILKHVVQPELQTN